MRICTCIPAGPNTTSKPVQRSATSGAPDHLVRPMTRGVDAFDALALLALLPSWLGLLGGRFRVLDLFAHFRWQYLVAGVLILAWAAWRRRRWVLRLAGPTLLLNALLIGQLAVHPAVSRAALVPGFSLHVVSLNVLQTNRHRQAVLDYLLASDADAVVLLEVDRRWLAALQPLQAKYPYHIAQPRPDATGVAFYSREPWRKAEVLRFGVRAIPSVQVRMTHQGREFILIGTHPLSPVGARRSRTRDRQFAWLADHVQHLDEPVLVVGDMNATPWSAGLRMARAGRLGFRSLDAPWAPTWHARSPLAIPIDHALCTAPLVVSRRSVGPDVGSDHRPLDVTIGWAE